MFEVKTIPLGALATNCHIIIDENKNCIAVDIAEAPLFLKYLKENNLKLKAIFLTHGHFDHIGGVEDVQKVYDVPVYLHEADKICLESSEYNVSYLLGKAILPDIKNIICLNDDNTEICILGINFKVIHTPGHTKGSVCYDTGDILFSGDTIFAGSRGRTDFPGGSNKDMLASFRLLKNLDGNRKIYTGHGSETTLDYERKTNINMSF